MNKLLCKHKNKYLKELRKNLTFLKFSIQFAVFSMQKAIKWIEDLYFNLKQQF